MRITHIAVETPIKHLPAIYNASISHRFISEGKLVQRKDCFSDSWNSGDWLLHRIIRRRNYVGLGNE